MTWLDKWIFSQPYYDKLLHAYCCGGLVLAAWFITFSLWQSALVGMLAGVVKEIVDCYNLADLYNIAYSNGEPLPEPARAHWEWYWDWWDILADVVGIATAVGLIWWRTGSIGN